MPRPRPAAPAARPGPEAVATSDNVFENVGDRVPGALKVSLIVSGILPFVAPFLTWLSLTGTVTASGSSSSASASIPGYLLPPAWMIALLGVPTLVLAMVVAAKQRFDSKASFGVPFLVIGALMVTALVWTLVAMMNGSMFTSNGQATSSASVLPGPGALAALASATTICFAGVSLTFSSKRRTRRSEPPQVAAVAAAADSSGAGDDGQSPERPAAQGRSNRRTRTRSPNSVMVTAVTWLVIVAAAVAAYIFLIPHPSDGSTSSGSSGPTKMATQADQFDALFAQMCSEASKEQRVARALWQAQATAIRSHNTAAASHMFHDWKYHHDLEEFASREFMSNFDRLAELWDPRR